MSIDNISSGASLVEAAEAFANAFPIRDEFKAAVGVEKTDGLIADMIKGDLMRAGFDKKTVKKAEKLYNKEIIVIKGGRPLKEAARAYETDFRGSKADLKKAVQAFKGSENELIEKLEEGRLTRHQALKFAPQSRLVSKARGFTKAISNLSETMDKAGILALLEGKSTAQAAVSAFYAK